LRELGDFVEVRSTHALAAALDSAVAGNVDADEAEAAAGDGED
jgi:hypothetical protein